MPVSTETLQLFAQFLSRSFRSVESIRNYISGVNFHWIKFVILNDLRKLANNTSITLFPCYLLCGLLLSHVLWRFWSEWSLHMLPHLFSVDILYKIKSWRAYRRIVQYICWLEISKVIEFQPAVLDSALGSHVLCACLLWHATLSIFFSRNQNVHNSIFLKKPR